MSWEDKAIKRLSNANSNVKDMKSEMLAWAINAQAEKGNQTFIQRSGLMLGSGLFLLGCAIALKLLGFFIWWMLGAIGLFILFRVLKYEFDRG